MTERMFVVMKPSTAPSARFGRRPWSFEYRLPYAADKVFVSHQFAAARAMAEEWKCDFVNVVKPPRFELLPLGRTARFSKYIVPADGCTGGLDVLWQRNMFPTGCDIVVGFGPGNTVPSGNVMTPDGSLTFRATEMLQPSLACEVLEHLLPREVAEHIARLLTI